MFGNLSNRQRIWLIVVLVFAVTIVAVGGLLQKDTPGPLCSEFTVEMSIKQIAARLNVTGKYLARELDLPIDTAKGKPVKALNITQEELGHAVDHILSHRETMLKYYILAGIVMFSLIYLVRLGRPDGSFIAERKGWYPRWIYVAVLVLVIAICGFALGKSPNPMESAVKVFKSFVGLYPSVGDKVWAFVFFAALAIVGNKLICGWACPFGAIQELIYYIPILKKLKKRKLPFFISNTIRSVLFVVMLLMLFGIVGGQEGFVIYHYVNPFNLFDFDFESVPIGATIVVALIVSFGFYRPFCQFICPFGLLSWFFERVSIFRVKIDRDRCINCGVCISACPLDAAKGRVAGRMFSADCFSCTRCLNVCPTDAIRYGFVVRKYEDQSERNDEKRG